MNEYDKVFEEFDTAVGFGYLRGIHLNDSKKALGSRVDRHDSIGKGLIGMDFFRRFMTVYLLFWRRPMNRFGQRR